MSSQTPASDIPRQRSFAALHHPGYRVFFATNALAMMADIVQSVRDIAANRTLASMTLLAGGASLFIGNAYQAQMPAFANDLGQLNAGFVELAFSAMAQTLVQLNAPQAIRGRAIGIHWSLALSAAALLVLAGSMLAWIRPRPAPT